MRASPRLIAALSMVFVVVLARTASTDATPALARAFDLTYNLDHEPAIAAFQQAIREHPDDPRGYRGLAVALWLHMGLRRGTVTIDSFIGGVRKPTKLWQPPPDMVKAFRDNIQQAFRLSLRQVEAAPSSVDAHFQLGATVGVMASYTATIDNRIFGAIGDAKRAFDEHEKVLAVDPSRTDAGLIVGIYRYVVAEMSFPMRLMAYLRGFGGGKEKGRRLIEAAARYPGDSQTDAKLALVLIYSRERRYAEAQGILAELMRRYPRNRLLWLESGATLLRARRWLEAEAVLSEGLRMFEQDRRTRMFGESALWHYKRGAARAALGRREAAEADLAEAVGSEGRDWVHGRARLELGRLAATGGDTKRARLELERAITLGDRDNDADTSSRARELLRGLDP